MVFTIVLFFFAIVSFSLEVCICNGLLKKCISYVLLICKNAVNRTTCPLSTFLGRNTFFIQFLCNDVGTVLRALSATLAPFLAKATAMLAPIPREEPEIKTFFPVNSIFNSSILPMWLDNAPMYPTDNVEAF